MPWILIPLKLEIFEVHLYFHNLKGKLLSHQLSTYPLKQPDASLNPPKPLEEHLRELSYSRRDGRETHLQVLHAVLHSMQTSHWKCSLCYRRWHISQWRFYLPNELAIKVNENKNLTYKGGSQLLLVYSSFNSKKGIFLTTALYFSHSVGTTLTY